MKNEMKTIVVCGQTLRMLDDITYEGENLAENIDFVIVKEGDSYIVDIFNTAIDDENEAHINSFEAGTLEEAVSYFFEDLNI